MAVPRPSQGEILQRIYNRITLETPISANLDSSAIGVILKIIAAEMDLVWSYISDLYNQSNLSTATGPALDNFGLLLGVPRKSAQNASTLGATPSVQFTNLGVGSADIPGGTRVFKDSDPSVAFFTVGGVTLTGGQISTVHVQAAQPGSMYNVGIGELNRSSAPNVTVAVTNILPIQNGSFDESDGSYRQRLLQEYTRRDVLNPTNCDAMLRQVPGVQDVYILDFQRGAGTFDVVIIPYNSSAISQVVSECLTENMMIALPDGCVTSIRSLVEASEKVYSLNLNTNIISNENISNFFSRKASIIHKVSTTRGYIKATINHNLHVYDREFNLVKKPVSEIDNSYYLPCLNSLPHVTKNCVTKEEAYLAGLILTDGHVSSRYIKIEMSKDSAWLSSKYYLASSLFSKTTLTLPNSNKRRTTSINIYGCSEINEFISKFQIPSGNKGKIIAIPKLIWNCSLDSVKSFITACFDAEGDVNTSAGLSINFNSTSEQFTLGLQYLLLKFGITSSIIEILRQTPHNNIYRLSLYGTDAKIFLDDIGFSIDRKQLKALNGLPKVYREKKRYPNKNLQDLWKKESKNRKYSSSFLREKLLEEFTHLEMNHKMASLEVYNRTKLVFENLNLNFVEYLPCTPITSITPFEEEVEVFDFEVANSHTFFVNGFLTSNCQTLLNEYVPIGISALARPPQYRQLDITANLQFDPSSMDNAETIRQSIRAQIISRIDNLPVEDGSGVGTFYTSQIRALAIMTDPSVLDAVVSIGLDGSPIAPNGTITLGIGQRLVLRSLTVN